MEFNWIISAMDCKVSEGTMKNVVHTVHWRYNAKETLKDKSYFAEMYGACPVGEPTPEDFTDYDSLTKDQVVSWLEATLDVESMQENLKKQIDLQINPIDETLAPPFEN
jgi:hypothetical protein